MSSRSTPAQSSSSMAARAFGAAAILGLADLCIAPLSGHLSDRWGRKRLMVLPWVLLFVLTLPAFLLITHVTTSMTLLAAMAVLAALKSLAIPAALVAITEAIPAASRSGTVAVTYALAVAIFGGTAQFIVAWLTDATGNPLAPAWYMTAALAVGVAAMVAMHETAPVRASERH